MELRAKTADGRTYTAQPNRGVRVPRADHDGWECRWAQFVCPTERVPRILGVHQWTHATLPSPPRLLISNGAWAPGLQYPQHVELESLDGVDFELRGGVNDEPWVFPLRFHTSGDLDFMVGVDPVWRVGPWVGYGNVHDAGEQGGHGIDLHPQYGQDTEFIAEATAHRNPIAAFHAMTGELLTRRELGLSEYRLDREHVGELLWSGNTIQQHRQFTSDFTWPASGASWELQTWIAIDCYHLSRASGPDYALWKAKKCPRARWRLMMLAQDVMNAWTLDPRVPGDLNLSRILTNVRAAPGGQNIGIIRGIAWSIRAVACALEAYGKPWREAEAWLRAWIEVVALSQGASGQFADHRAGQSIDQEAPWNLFGLDRRKGENPTWQHPFLIRALFHAQQVLAEVDTGAPDETPARVRAIVAKWLTIYETCPLVPNEDGHTTRDLPVYVVTSAPQLNGTVDLPRGASPSTVETYYDASIRLVDKITEPAWGLSRDRYFADVHAVAVRLGIIERVPERYSRSGAMEDVADVLVVDKEFPA